MIPRKPTLLLVTLTLATRLLGTTLEPFTSYSDIIRSSRDIVIVRCTKEPERPYIMTDSGRFSDVEVLSVLKGNTRLGASRMITPFIPKQGDRYLVIGTHVAEGQSELGPYYDARPEWRVIPIPRFLRLEGWEGKTMTEKIQTIIDLRLQELERLTHDLDEEKKHLNGSYDVKQGYIYPNAPRKAN